jgi:hypothetical protein
MAYYYTDSYASKNGSIISSYIRAERLFSNVASIKAGKPISTRVRIYSGDGTKTPAFYRASVAGQEVLYLHSDGTLELVSGPDEWRRAGQHTVSQSGSRYLPLEIIRIDRGRYGVITDKLCRTLQEYFIEVARGRSPDAPAFIGERGEQMRKALDEMTTAIRAGLEGAYKNKKAPRYVTNMMLDNGTLRDARKLWATTLMPFLSEARRGLRFNVDGIAENDIVRVSKADVRMSGLTIDKAVKREWDAALVGYRKQIRTIAAIGALDHLMADIIEVQSSPGQVAVGKSMVGPMGFDRKSPAGIAWTRIAYNVGLPTITEMLVRSVRSGSVDQDTLHWLVWHANSTQWFNAANWSNARHAPSSVEMGKRIMAFLSSHSFAMRCAAGVITTGNTVLDTSGATE